MGKKAFIVSTGRTGTKFLSNTLNKYSTIYSTHEPKPDMNWVRLQYMRWRNNAFRRMSYRNSLPWNHYAYWKFKWSRWWLAAKSTENKYVEANGNLSVMLPLVREAFPRSRIVYIVRDPREVIASGLKQGWYIHKDKRTRPNAIYTGEMTDEEWEKLTPLERLNWFYLYINHRIQKADPETTIEFDDIFQKPHAGFRTLLETLDIDGEFEDNWFERKVNRSTFDLVPDYSEWSDEWKQQIQPSVDWYDKNFK